MSDDRIKITLSERRPIKLDPNEWPIIASSTRSHTAGFAEIVVREHASGRRVVYGRADGHGDARARGGFLVEPVAACPDEHETIRSIRRVAGILDDDRLGTQCIAELPAEDV